MAKKNGAKKRGAKKVKSKTIPLSILKRRYERLGKIIKSRSR